MSPVRRLAPRPSALLIDPSNARPAVTIGHDDDGNPVRVPPVFTAVWDQLRGVGVVELDFAAEPGRVRVVEARIRPKEGDSITNLALRGVAVRHFAAAATERFGWLTGGSSSGARQAARSATKSRVSDDRLAQVLKAHAEGGVQAVIDLEHVSRRHAFRLLAQARAASGA